MQEASKDEMLVKEVGEKGLSPFITFINTGELELGDLSWAGTDYTDFLNLQLMKFDLKGGMIADRQYLEVKGGVIQLYSLSSRSESRGEGDSEVLQVTTNSCPLPASTVISR